MTDFHSHILPGMDDGSKTAEMTVKMLEVSAENGVDAIVATPHFYPKDEDPDLFLERRAEAVASLTPYLEGRADLPKIMLGAEVAYYRGIGKSESVRRLAIEGTNVILIEMPEYRWPDAAVDDLVYLSKEQRLRPVIAHLERCAFMQPKQTIERLRYEDILFQTNASFVTSGFFAARKSMKLIADGMISLIGTDCHNLDTRAPDMKKATDKIAEKLGDEFVSRLNMNARMLLHSAATIN